MANFNKKKYLYKNKINSEIQAYIESIDFITYITYIIEKKQLEDKRNKFDNLPLCRFSKINYDSAICA